MLVFGPIISIIHPKVLDILQNKVFVMNWMFIYKISFNFFVIVILSVRLEIFFAKNELIGTLVLIELELFDDNVLIQILVFPKIVMSSIEMSIFRFGWCTE